MFVGMSMDTTREDMTLAVLEGVAFGLRDSLEAARSLESESIPPESVVAEPRVLSGDRLSQQS